MFLNILRISASNVVNTFLNIIVIHSVLYTRPFGNNDNRQLVTVYLLRGRPLLFIHSLDT